MPSLSPFPLRRRPAVAAAAGACLLVAGAACIPVTTGYPAVVRTDVAALVATDRDTAWVLSRPPLTVVGRSRETLEVPGGLTGVTRSWVRMFGREPGPATVVLVEVRERGQAAPRPTLALPDSLQGRPVVWVPTVRFDDGARESRMGGFGGGPRMVGGAGGSAALQLAQAWLDAHLSATSATGIPPWLRAGLVEALGGNEVLMGSRGGRRRGAESLPLDTLVARTCAADWSPVPRWRPRPPDVDSLNAEREARTNESDRERAFEENMRAPCGLRFRMAAGSFVRYLLERGGDDLAAGLVRTHAAGGTLEQAVAGRQGLPPTRAELERAWRGWEVQREDEERNRAAR